MPVTDTASYSASIWEADETLDLLVFLAAIASTPVTFPGTIIAGAMVFSWITLVSGSGVKLFLDVVTPDGELKEQGREAISTYVQPGTLLYPVGAYFGGDKGGRKAISLADITLDLVSFPKDLKELNYSAIGLDAINGFKDFQDFQKAFFGTDSSEVRSSFRVDDRDAYSSDARSDIEREADPNGLMCTPPGMGEISGSYNASPAQPPPTQVLGPN